MAEAVETGAEIEADARRNAAWVNRRGVEKAADTVASANIYAAEQGAWSRERAADTVANAVRASGHWQADAIRNFDMNPWI
jgi:UDP-N-acetylmuramate-alanine ligase